MEYELLFFTTVANEEKIDSIKRDLNEILTSLGGKLTGEYADIGKRKLAYPIKRNTHAFFSFVRFELEDRQNISEIGKRIGLYEKVMRHLIVRADEIGKPVAISEIKAAEEAVAKKIQEPKKETVPVKPEPVAEKSKASLAELDEKLSRILEDTPS